MPIFTQEMKQRFYKKISEGTHLYVWVVHSCANTLFKGLDLTSKELEQYNTLNIEKRKVEFLACRRALKNIFTSKLVLQHHETGQPFIKETPHISIAHSHKYIAIVFGTDNIGIDIELPQKKIQQVISRILSAKEYKSFLKNPSTEQACKLWGIKEAVLKYVGDKKLNYRDDIKVDQNKVSYFNDQFVFQHEYIDQMILTYVQKKE